ncbi:MAG: Methyltransf 20 protein [Candidatus Levybacteria bacterium]|nr:Methyltransf 20 protein [Candidatus Levybacteria bacterium]
MKNIEPGNGVNPPLFPDIKPSDSVSERRKKVLNQFAPKIREKTPYDSSEFEYFSPIGEHARKILVNGMVSLSGNEGYELFRTSEDLEYISDNEATHKALDRMYEGPLSENPNDLIWSRLFIENTHNSMAVRNRLRIVKEEFTSHMENALLRQEGPLQVLSVAAGSSRAIMESLKSLNGTIDDRIALKMVDSSDEALTDGQQLVGKLGIDKYVNFTKANFLPTTKYMDDKYQPEFVEVVGLFDYLADAHIVRFLRELKSHMVDGGAVLYSNIAPNDEQDFTHNVVGWRQMEYRTSGDLARLATDAGFGLSNVRVLQEPLGVYNLAVATK